jgi:hypothetical protein
MEGVRELEAFAAVVYSSHFEIEADESGKVDLRDEKMSSREDVETAGVAEGRTKRAVDVAESAVAGGKGIVASTWGLFDSVWGRVVGGGEGPITG